MERRLTPNSSSSNLLTSNSTHVSSAVKIIGHESYGSSSQRNSYVFTPVSSSDHNSPLPLGTLDSDTSIERRRNGEGWNLRSIEQFFRSVFLPQGFPESVSEDYLQYQIWDTVQAFASSITHSLATQALLKGVGVGDTSATVLAATVTWLMKDGVSMLGRILFAWMQSSYLDCDCKRWRLFADAINDCSIFLEILASYFSDYFRVIVCISGLCHAVVGVAGSATRAALTQHQARRNNMADVSAKDGSQETLVNLAALICSLLLMPVVANDQNLVWILFIFFTSLHLFANYCAVTSVRMETFNQSRLHLVVKDMLRQVHVQGQGHNVGLHGLSTVLNVQQTNQQEPVLWKTRRRLAIRLGCSLHELNHSQASLTSVISFFEKSLYLINVNVKQGVICIALHTSAQYGDQLKACYHAEVLEYCYDLAVEQKYNSDMRDSPLHSIISAFKSQDLLSVLDQSYKYVQSHWPTFQTEAESVGWKIDPVQLCADEWRSEWSLQGLDSKKVF